MAKDKAGHGAIILIIVLLLLPSTGFGFRIREVSSLPIERTDQIYGQSTGNIIIKKEDRLVLLNRLQQIRSEVKLDSSQSAVVAENGLFYCFVSKPENEDSVSSGPTATIYSNREMPLWSVYELAEGICYLAPSGDFLVVISGTVGWFNYKMLLYHKDRPMMEVDIQSFENLQFSDDSHFLLIDAGAKGIKLYDADGELIQQYGSQKMVALSGKGKKIAAYDYKGTLRIFDGPRKKLELDLKQLSIRDLIFRDDINTIAIIYDFRIVVLDAVNGTILWEYGSGKEGGLFASLDISPNNRFVSCGIDVSKGTSADQQERHILGYLYVFDIEGQTLQEIKYEYENYSKGLPNVEFLSDNRTIAVRNAESLHFVEIY